MQHGVFSFLLLSSLFYPEVSFSEMGPGLADLPPELLQVVFCQISLPELLRSHSHVCRRWFEVITSVKFQPQKKLYYKYQANHQDTREILKLEVIKRLREIPDTFGRLISEVDSNFLARCLPFLVEKFSDPSIFGMLCLADSNFASVNKHPR